MIETEVRSYWAEGYEHIGTYIKGTGIFHNENGPALICPDIGFIGYFVNGNCHRTEGPAKVWRDHPPEVYLNDFYFKDIKTNEEWIIKQIIE
jgi:hypothetical protein